jgi:hypothetical protein
MLESEERRIRSPRFHSKQPERINQVDRVILHVYIQSWPFAQHTNGMVIFGIGTFLDWGLKLKTQCKLLNREIMVGAKGFEPSTSWSRTKYLNPINALSGVAYGTRSVIFPS